MAEESKQYAEIKDVGTTGQDGLSSLNTSMSKPADKDYSEFRQFVAGMDSTNQNLAGFNPLMRGVARIHIYRMPYFMTKQYENLSNRFKQYFETNYRRVDGIGDISTAFADFEGGFAPRRFSNPIQVRDDTDTITVSMYEQSGSPLTNFIKLWMTGVRDLQTGIAHYHGLLDKDKNLQYGEQNHTAEFIYYTLDPTHRKIEYACMFAHGFPTRAPQNHFNFDAGQRDNVEVDLEFNVVKYESRAINDIAHFYLATDTIKKQYLDVSYLNFNPYSKKGTPDNVTA